MNSIILAVALSAGLPAYAGTHVPGKVRAQCQRLLIKTSLLHPPVSAVVRPLSGAVEDHKTTVAAQVSAQFPMALYARTNRDRSYLLRLDPHYPREFLRNESLAGKKILDLACGSGALVEELLRVGHDIIGVDILLDAYQLTKPYFVRASAAETGLPPASFDIIFSTQGPLTYREGHFEEMTLLMKEIHRLLKPGGVLRISSVGSNLDYERLLKSGANPHTDLSGTIYTNLPPGLRLKSWPNTDWFLSAAREAYPARYWLEIERVD